MRSQLNIDDSGVERVGYDVQVLERADEESTGVVLEVDGDSDSGVWLQSDKPFRVGKEKAHYLFDFHIQVERTMSTSGQSQSCMSKFSCAFDYISALAD